MSAPSNKGILSEAHRAERRRLYNEHEKDRGLFTEELLVSLRRAAIFGQTFQLGSQLGLLEGSAPPCEPGTAAPPYSFLIRVERCVGILGRYSIVYRTSSRPGAAGCTVHRDVMRPNLDRIATAICKALRKHQLQIELVADQQRRLALRSIP